MIRRMGPRCRVLIAASALLIVSGCGSSAPASLATPTAVATTQAANDVPAYLASLHTTLSESEYASFGDEKLTSFGQSLCSILHHMRNSQKSPETFYGRDALAQGKDIMSAIEAANEDMLISTYTVAITAATTYLCPDLAVSTPTSGPVRAGRTAVPGTTSP
jgi:hypothetical protein